jgi:UDP-galactopyranose mutase
MPVIVLGAGLAGLSAARHLQGRCEVFEKEPWVGGHSRTKRVDGFNFDEGAHVFFGDDECSATFVWKPLGHEMLSHEAEIWNHYEEHRFGRYPVQVNAAALEPTLATRCVLDFIEAARQPDVPAVNYAEWCYASFGRSFADNFMLRYARKVWTVEPEELTTEWLGSKVGGRISRPALEQVIRGAIDRQPSILNYLTRFSYPARGGFARLAEPVGAGIAVRTGCALTRVITAERRLVFADGTERVYDAAISTIPLPALIALCEDAPNDVRQAASSLMWTSLRCVNLGVARSDVGPGHWCYFYDHAIPFFRISFPSKFAPDNAPNGMGSISCEIAYSSRRPLDERDLVARVVDSLRSVGVLRSDDQIVLQDQIDVPYAYVVFDHRRAAALSSLHGWMRTNRLYPCGRFGEWGYHWSFEALDSGRRVAAEVARDLGLAS